MKKKDFVGFIICFGLMFLLMSFQQRDNRISQSDKTDTLYKNMPKELIELERVPEYSGGEYELLKFVETNLNKSIVSGTTMAEGKVIVRFTIDTIGKAIDFRVVKSYNLDVDNEFLRVLKLMPKWKPGETWTGNRNDSFKKTKCYYTFPLKIPFKGYNLVE